MPEIEVSEFVLERLDEYKEHFRKEFGLPDFNYCDTIHEFLKFIDTQEVSL